MKQYEIVLAFNVPCYAVFTVDAESREAAIQQALVEAADTSFTPEWDCGDSGSKLGDPDFLTEEYRLVDIAYDRD